MNLRNGSSGKKEAKVCVITSGKGGVGKTTTAANIGAALALRGKRTLLIDADIGLRNLDVILGLENRIVFNLVDVAKDVCKPNQAVIKSKKTNNLFMLPASQTDEKDVIDEEDMKRVLELYRREYQYILIDSPAGIEQGFKNACTAADEAILVTTPEVAAIRDADRVIGLLTARGIDAQLVLNRVDYGMVRRGDMLSVDDVQDILGTEILGVVERDEQIIVAANCGEPVVYNTRSRAGQAFCDIAARLCGDSVPLNHFGGANLWGRISRRLGVA